ncbi:MAG: CHASE2 domain-containing protein [Treponema sp.]|nr:CHASE2 domain-containing protein [Treponema sp.]
MKKFASLLIITAVTIFWVVLGGTGVLQKLDYRFFDFLLKCKPAPQEKSEILLVEADNLALENVGPWPWKRDVYADSLLHMKELGAKSAIFDIEFLSPSNFPEADEYFSKALQFFGNSTLSINARDLDINYSKEDLDYAADRFLIKPQGDINAIIDGNNKSSYETQKNTLLGYGKTDWTDPKVRFEFSKGMSPSMNLFISHAKHGTFTNTIVDNDGSRRRVELLSHQIEYDKSILQLVLANIMENTQAGSIIRKKDRIIIKDAFIDGKQQDINIPLDSSGRMIINWTHNLFENSFRHESIAFLDMLTKTENNIYEASKIILNSMAELNSPVIDQQAEKLYELFHLYNDILEYKAYMLSLCEGYDENSNPVNGGISDLMYEEYFGLRKDYFERIAAYAGGNSGDEIQQELLNLRDSLGEEKYTQNAQLFGQMFDILKDESTLYNDVFKEKSQVYKDAFCILGTTASSTTDQGTTPFQRSYPNVGTHANVYNTIMNRDFITPVNWLWGILIIFVLTVVQGELTKKNKALIQNIAGLAIVITAILIPVILIAGFGIYMPSVASILIAFTAYLSITVYRFSTAEKDKKFLKNTFGAYVAPAIVDQIVKHPEYANLGGKSEYLTALFSDVKTFSGFTEVINNEAGEDKGAERLVEILNGYLGVLSDAIMENNGTIDKYVGDEIVSFFGAPVQTKNNAFDACVAGIRMLQAEKKFNEENKDKLPVNPRTGEPFWLRSRVGLNTGNMVVGNMGTAKKLNYTIMGNNVNLASRLEGTNKVYGSWIMCSESTWQMANSGEYEGKLVARKFDCVRVVNVKKPVGIYNILGLKDEMSPQQIEAAQMFNKGIEIYLKGSDTPEVKKEIIDLVKAKEYFEKARDLYPQDESSQVFIERCDDFIKNGLPEIWDGVYTMKSK